MTEENYDVVVIGGGSTGTAVARDCALRGLKTLLLERDDLASATVGTCAGMISSGLKYMDEPEIVDMCSEEVVYLNRIARHIIMRNPILTPILEMSDLSTGGNFAAEYSKRAQSRDVPPVLFLEPEDTLVIEPSINPDLIASMYFEEFFIDPFRLCLLQALDAKEHGADIRTYCEVIAIGHSDGSVKSVTYYNRVSGETETIGTKVIVNAAGPWADKIAGLAGARLELRLNKGAHVILDRRVVNVGIISKAVDGRMIYLFPHENTTLLGTTALDTWEDPDTLVASHDEIEYLLQSIEWIIPSIREARIIRTMEGVRPLIPTWKVPEDKVTRGYEVINHEKDGVAGLVSFTGGKLVMCRHMAEAATNLIAQRLGIDAKCSTHEKPLPGNEADVDVLALAKDYGVKQHTLERMRSRRGTEIVKILELTKEHPDWKTAICICEPTIEAEIRYSIREEFPQTLNDLRRRVRLGTGPCQGAFCTYKAASILAEELDLNGDDYLVDILDFRAERWKGIRQPMRGEQLAQEELTQGIYACVGNLDRAQVEYDPKPWEEGA
ncbi:MAG: FAD-dependent oxidoreductase [Candidatus Thorarchaeota archaeon]|nr:FAD-dependent oxidoreductase [Candidatus Thorarchaeota archaeon]